MTPPHATPPTPRPEGSTMTICKRKCHDCGNVADHEDNVVPQILCKVCGSQDTRLAKPTPDLPALIESARGHTMTPEEREVQGASFAAGNVGEEREGERRTVMEKPDFQGAMKYPSDPAKELARYSMSAGIADHYRRCAREACKSLGLSDDDSLAPHDVRDAIDDLRRRLALAEQENARMKALILSFGNNPAGFDWSVLGQIDELEVKLALAETRVGELEKAGDNMHRALDNALHGIGMDTEFMKAAQGNWDQAKAGGGA